MKNRLNAENGMARNFLLMLAMLPVFALAQVPVDENGEIIGSYEPRDSAEATGNEEIPLLSEVDLEELVGPIALYPDDLLAIVLPASAYPLQIVEAARFLEDLENDSSLKPDPEWDDSVVALLNYPEVIELLNEDIDWTWRLGEAVVSQQTDVVAAIETFRDRAYAAGNLKSDAYQNVSRDEGIIEIIPISEDVIYVPYYEPERVVVYQPRPVYYYYPRPYPVYYYPYASNYAFDRGFFWGVTTAFTIGWYTDSLHVFHHSYHGHPYFGRSYWDRWWYRRPALDIHTSTYVGRNTNVTINRYYGGDRWRARSDRRDYIIDRRDGISPRRVTRNRHYPSDSTGRTTNDVAQINNQRRPARANAERRDRQREPIAFRDRPQTIATNRNERTNRSSNSDRRERTARTTNRDAQRDRATNVRSRTDATRQRRQEPAARRETPAVRREQPAVRRETPAVRRDQPATRRQTPTVRRQTPTVRRETPAVRREQPAVRRQTPTVRRESPAVRRSTPAVQREAPAARREQPQRRAAQPQRAESKSSPKRAERSERKSESRSGRRR